MMRTHPGRDFGPGIARPRGDGERSEFVGSERMMQTHPGRDCGPGIARPRGDGERSEFVGSEKSGADAGTRTRKAEAEGF